nr:hypothetical protein [Tanacetum cinerariifolium]
APPSSDYIPGPEEPEQAPPFPDYVSGLEHDDDEIEDDDEVPKEDHVDYPADGGDEGDDEEGSSEDDEDDDIDIEADKDEEEEHPAPADSVVVALPAADRPHLRRRLSRLRLMSLQPHHRHTLHIIPFPPLSPILSPPSPVLSPSPPPSPIRSLGYRAAMIRLRAEAASTSHSPPLPPPFILSPTRSDALSSGIPPPLPISAPTSSPPLHLPSTSHREDKLRRLGIALGPGYEVRESSSAAARPAGGLKADYGFIATIDREIRRDLERELPSASRREDRPEVTLPPRKRLDIALGPRYEVGESSSAAVARPAGGFREDYGFVATVDREIMRDPEREVSYGITDSWDKIVETLQGAPVSTDMELVGYVREFETRVRQDTDEIYMKLDDEQTERQLLAGQLNMLFRDRRAHAYTRQLMETEARMSREAWVRATNASDLVHGEVISLRTTVLGQMSEIKKLQAANRKRQTVISELLRIDHRRSTEISELRTALQGQQGPVGDPTQPGNKWHRDEPLGRPTDQEAVNATTVTNAQLHAMIDQGVTVALAVRDALRSTNGDDSHNSGTGVRRTERATLTNF